MVDFAPPAPSVGLSGYIDVSRLVFLRLPPGWFGDWHHAPKKQFFCCLKDQIEITTCNGEVRRFSQRDVFLLENISGRGIRRGLLVNRNLLQRLYSFGNDEPYGFMVRCPLQYSVLLNSIERFMQFPHLKLIRRAL